MFFYYSDRDCFALFVRYVSLSHRHVLLNGLVGLEGLLGYVRDHWAEQFGTNLRATAATTIPNMVRGTTVMIQHNLPGIKGLLGSLPLQQDWEATGVYDCHLFDHHYLRRITRIWIIGAGLCGMVVHLTLF
ncbi:MAG: hypothetical protein IPO69_00120 [Saprospiraceae bacterium]|nr:hypothetical protein [Saprospiraceae bacterium]